MNSGVFFRSIRTVNKKLTKRINKKLTVNKKLTIFINKKLTNNTR
jgi:hypothetical protein